MLDIQFIENGGQNNMSTPRIILGNMEIPTQVKITTVDSGNGEYYFNDYSKEQGSRWKIGHVVNFRVSSEGPIRAQRVILESSYKQVFGPYIRVSPLTSSELAGGSPSYIENNTLVDTGTAGLFVSASGVDVTNPADAQTGNLIFDSTNYIDNSLFVNTFIGQNPKYRK